MTLQMSVTFCDVLTIFFRAGPAEPGVHLDVVKDGVMVGVSPYLLRMFHKYDSMLGLVRRLKNTVPQLVDVL